MGKTTAFLKFIAENKSRWKFVFDPELEIVRKWKVARHQTVDSMVAVLTNSVKTGKPCLIAFDPAQMFPGDFRGALDFFCKWCLEVCRPLHGEKLVCVDEIQKFTKTGVWGVPQGLTELLDTGRREEIDFACVCNRGINELNDDVRAQMTEAYCFRTTEPLALRILEKMGFDPKKLPTLKKGQSIKLEL